MWYVFSALVKRYCSAKSRLLRLLGGRQVEPGPITYLDALQATPRLLQGIPTYRMQRHPSYAAVFSGTVHKAIWARAMGSQVFTRLVRPGVWSAWCSHALYVVDAGGPNTFLGV